jgi:hypothetical protein
MDIQGKLRNYLIGWFVVTSIVLILPSVILLFVSIGYRTPPTLPQPPIVPRAIKYPSFKDTLLKDETLSKELITAYTDIFKKQVDGQTSMYEKQINLYKEELAAWKQVEDKRPKMDPYSIYELVINKTLSPLITALLTAFVTYAFVVKGADTVARYVAEQRAARIERRNTDSGK